QETPDEHWELFASRGRGLCDRRPLAARPRRRGLADYYRRYGGARVGKLRRLCRCGRSCVARHHRVKQVIPSRIGERPAPGLLAWIVHAALTGPVAVVSAAAWIGNRIRITRAVTVDTRRGAPGIAGPGSTE